MQHCNNICKRFKGYTKFARTYYRNGIIFCPVCDCGFLSQGQMCHCCMSKVRNNRAKHPNDHKYAKLVS